MKNLLLALLFLPSLAQAGGPADGSLTCSVNEFYSRFWLKWDEKTVSVEVHNPRGFKGMPQMEAPFSLENIPFLEFQSKELEGLGESFIYKWDRSQCEFSEKSQWLVSCHGKVSAEPDNGVNALSFTTAQIEEKSLSGDFSVLRLRFIFGKSSMFFVAMPFPLKDCIRK